MDSTYLLKINDLKVTPVRTAILLVLAGEKGPIDVSEIIKKLEASGVSSDPATVFRTMNSFVEKKIIRPIQLFEGKVRYEMAGLEDHHHFICKNCGAIQDISDCNISSLEKEIEKEKKVKVHNHSLEFFGFCTKCIKVTQK